MSTRRAVGLGAALVAVVVAGAAITGGGGDDAPSGPLALDGTWEVTLVVGARSFSDEIDGRGLTAEGDGFIENWRFECDDAGCTLTRPDGGPLLGELDAPIALAPVATGDDDDARLAGTGSSALPLTADGADPCAGSAALAWSVEVEVARVGDGLEGSLTRTPDALLAPNATGLECIGLGLVLGLSGAPVGPD